MCKTPGCIEGKTFPCKSCGATLCKWCKRAINSGKMRGSGTSPLCPECHKKFSWSEVKYYYLFYSLSIQ